MCVRGKRIKCSFFFTLCLLPLLEYPAIPSYNRRVDLNTLSRKDEDCSSLGPGMKLNGSRYACLIASPTFDPRHLQSGVFRLGSVFGRGSLGWSAVINTRLPGTANISYGTLPSTSQGREFGEELEVNNRTRDLAYRHNIQSQGPPVMSKTIAWWGSADLLTVPGVSPDLRNILTGLLL